LSLAIRARSSCCSCSIEPAGRAVGRALATPQQIADRGDVNLIRLFAAHHLLAPVLFDRIPVNQRDRLGSSAQVAGQVLKVMPGRFQAGQDHLGSAPRAGFVYRGAQGGETALKDIDLKGRRHDLAQGIVDHHDVKILANIQGDAQGTFRGDVTNSVGEGLTAIAFQMGGRFVTQGWYLLSAKSDPAREIAEGLACASPVFDDGLRSRAAAGRRFFICPKGSGVNPARRIS